MSVSPEKKEPKLGAGLPEPIQTPVARAPVEPYKPDLSIVTLPQLFKPKGGHFDLKTKVALWFIGAAVLASMFVRVDQVITAPGKVVPSSRIKTIQHLEGGIVKMLHVKEGDVVKEGDTLVELDLATAGININELHSRTAALEMTRARLVAEATGVRPKFDKELTAQFPELEQTEMATFLARKAELNGVLEVNESQMESSRRKVGELEAKLVGLQSRANTAERELEITRELVREKLVSQLEYLDKVRNAEGLKSEVAATRETILSAKAAVGERVAKRAEEEGRFRRRAADELTTIERQLTSLKEDVGRATDQRERAVIKSPIAGVVKNLKLQAIGNVVRQGEPIMEVVPNDEILVIEARLSPADRGYAKMHQTADIKVSAYDFLRYGSLTGTVTQIAADTDPGDPSSGPYYKVIVSTQKAFFGTAENPQRISPGMTADVDIHVGSQPFIWYLIKPVLKLKEESFREP